MSKNPRDKINKACWNLVAGIKDSASSNLTIAVTQRKIDIKPEELVKLLALVNASIDEGAHRASRIFDREVNSALVLVLPDEKTTKKKPA